MIRLYWTLLNSQIPLDKYMPFSCGKKRYNLIASGCHESCAPKSDCLRALPKSGSVPCIVATYQPRPRNFAVSISEFRWATRWHGFLNCPEAWSAPARPHGRIESVWADAPIPEFPMEFPWFCMILHSFPWFCMVSFDLKSLFWMWLVSHSDKKKSAFYALEANPWALRPFTHTPPRGFKKKLPRVYPLVN